MSDGELGSGRESRAGWGVWDLFCLEERMEGGERAQFVQVRRQVGVSGELNSGRIFRGLLSGD